MFLRLCKGFFEGFLGFSKIFWCFLKFSEVPLDEFSGFQRLGGGPEGPALLKNQKV